MGLKSEKGVDDIFHGNRPLSVNMYTILRQRKHTDNILIVEQKNEAGNMVDEVSVSK